jgi:transposase
MQKKHRVKLTDDERQQLMGLISVGTGPARRATHARILLKADESPSGPAWDDATIAAAVEVSRPTVERVRKRFDQEGLTAALEHRPPAATRPRRLDGAQEAHLIALTCSDPPGGAGRWTLRLLAEKMVALEYVTEVSYETIRRTLKKTTSSRG